MFSSSSRLHWGNPPAAGQGVWLDAWMDKQTAKRPSGHWVGPVNLVSEPHHLPNKAAFVFIVYKGRDEALCKHGFWAYFLLISPCFMNNSGLLASDLWMQCLPSCIRLFLFKTDPGFTSGMRTRRWEPGRGAWFAEEKLRSSQGRWGRGAGRAGGGWGAGMAG